MGKISRAGNERLRTLFVSGATSVINAAMKPGRRQMTEGPRALLLRKPRKLVAVALANKIARTAWAMMTSCETYQRRRGRGVVGMTRLIRFTAQTSRNDWEWNHAPSIGQ
jgi:hypothetical protein